MSILYDFNDALRTDKVLVPWPAALALKAGAPLDADGAVSNGDDAIGILLKDGDIGKTVVINGAGYIECEIMTGGYLDQDAAEASCGLEYDDDLIAELTGITFVKGGVLNAQTLPAIGESDEGKVLTVNDGATVWAEASGGGGGADIVIRLNINGDGDPVSATTIRTLDYETLCEKYSTDPSSVSVFVYSETEDHRTYSYVSHLACELVEEFLNFSILTTGSFMVVNSSIPYDVLLFTPEGWVLD